MSFTHIYGGIIYVCTFYSHNDSPMYILLMAIVGYQPVLHPGHVFAYMSGCHLTTKQGTMGGLLHMAVVDVTTPDAKVGDQVAALKPEFKGVHLVLPVAKFVLKVPE